MNSSTLRRFMPMLALLFCAGASIVHAQPAKPDPAPTPAPASAAVAPAPAPTADSDPSDKDAADKPDWDTHDEDHDGSDQGHRHGRHSATTRRTDRTAMI